MSRREFLRTAVLGAGVGALAHVLSPRLADFLSETSQWEYDPTFHIYLKEKVFNFDFASQLARRFNTIWESMTPALLPADEEHIKLWIDEIAPLFEENGIFPTVRDVDTIELRKYTRADEHLRVLASSDCENYINVNFRFANPVSSWDGNPLVAAVVTHEFDHIQQGDACNAIFYVGNEAIEQHAVVTAYEVLAYSANSGNRIAQTSLVYLLRRELFRSAWGLADAEGRMTEFDRLCETIHDPVERSMVQQEWRELEKVRVDPNVAFRTYSITPLSAMINAYFTGQEYPKTVVLDLATEYDTGEPGHSFEFPGFPLDDLWYFMAHAESLVT